jgi:site-specific DNA recombinase
VDAKAVDRARFGDFSGLNLAGLVRVSMELRTTDEDEGGAAPARQPITGREIRSRDEQEKDCRAYVARGGGEYVYTYEEPDTSAYKRRRVTLPDGRRAYRVVRPVYAAALDDLKQGVAPNGSRLDGLVVYDIDRLTRDNRDLEDAIEVVQHFGRPILDWTGTLDLLTDNGRTVARIVVATANKQSADTARRVARKHRALEQAGIPTGGTRPFGWLADKRTLHPAEAAELRQAAERLLRGAPISSIPADWNRRGVRTSAGKKWTTTNVRALFRNPRLCGYRARTVHALRPTGASETRWKEIVLDSAGQPVIGQWEAIITPAEWEAVNARLEEGGTRPPGHNTRKHLLTGTLRCGKNGCSGRLRVVKRKATPRRPERFYYACQPVSEGGCGGIAIDGQTTDRVVTELVLAKYEAEADRRGASAQAADVPWPQQSELDRVREDMTAITGQWRTRRPDGTRNLSDARYFPQMAAMEDEERALLADRKRYLAAATTGKQARPVRALWDGYTLPQKRAFIEQVLVAVMVNPAIPSGGRLLDETVAGRLDPAWQVLE